MGDSYAAMLYMVKWQLIVAEIVHKTSQKLILNVYSL